MHRALDGCSSGQCGPATPSRRSKSTAVSAKGRKMASLLFGGVQCLFDCCGRARIGYDEGERLMMWSVRTEWSIEHQCDKAA